MAMDETNYGGGFGSALYDILLQKRKEAREAMLDEVNRKNVESEIAARADAAETNKMYRAAEASKMKAEEADRFMKRFHKGQEVGPEAYGQAKDYGLQDSFSAPIPDMGPDFQGPMQPGQTPGATPGKFLGSPQEIDADERRKQMSDWLDSPEGQEFKKNEPDAWAVMKSQALSEKFGAAIPAGAFRKNDPASENVPFLWVDRNGNVVNKGSYPKGATIRVQPAPPSSASENPGTWTQVDIEDPDNPGHMKTVLYNSKTREVKPLELPPELQPRPQQVPTPNTPVVPPPANQTFTPNGTDIAAPTTPGAQKDPRLTTTIPPAAPRVFSRGTAPKPSTAAADKGISSAEITGIRTAFEQTRKNLKSGAQTGQSRQVMYTPLHVAQMAIISHLPDQWMRNDVISAIQAAESVDYNNTKFPFGPGGVPGTIQDFIDQEEDPAGNPLDEQQKANLYRILSYALGNF